MFLGRRTRFLAGLAASHCPAALWSWGAKLTSSLCWKTDGQVLEEEILQPPRTNTYPLLPIIDSDYYDDTLLFPCSVEHAKRPGGPPPCLAETLVETASLPLRRHPSNSTPHPHPQPHNHSSNTGRFVSFLSFHSRSFCRKTSLALSSLSDFFYSYPCSYPSYSSTARPRLILLGLSEFNRSTLSPFAITNIS